MVVLVILGMVDRKVLFIVDFCVMRLVMFEEVCVVLCVMLIVMVILKDIR